MDEYTNEYTKVFENAYGQPENNTFSPLAGQYEGAYPKAIYQGASPNEPYEAYDMQAGYENDGYEVLEDDGAYDEFEEGEYASEEGFHVALGALDIISMLAGVAAVFVLTALIISLISWLRADISHMFSMFGSRIQ